MNRLQLAAQVTIQAADNAAPSLTMVAYTGAAIRQPWSRTPIVVDLAGMDAADQIPILYGHEATLDSVLGQSTTVTNTGDALELTAELFGTGDTAAKVLALAKAGLRLQASIGADTGDLENVPAGQAVTVNGRDFTGPLSIVRGSRLREVSVVLFGADQNTSATIAAEAENVSPSPHEVPTMAHDATHEPVPSTEATANVAADHQVTTAAPAPDAAAIKAELLREIKAELLENVRASRPAAPAIHVATPAVDSPAVVEASLAIAGGLQNPEKHYSEQTLEAAGKRRNTSLGEVLVNAARANGYDGSHRIGNANLRQILQAAFATHAIQTIVGNAYGKFLLNGYNSVEQVWSAIASIRSVSDFKAVTGVRLGGGFKFEEVSPGGELKSADAAEESRTIRAKTYGRLSSITRQDLVNDDLSALTAVPQRLGRGAALALNAAFWAEFESSNATFYKKEAAGAGNALSLSSLKTATASYRKLTDPDDNPLGIAPRILLVPAELEIAAAELMGGSLLITGENATKANVNVLAGRYRVVSSAYLTSASTWWLCADPMDLPAMEVAFLNGNQTPTVEQAEADFNTLGIQVRGYHDWGIAKAESRAAYRMATA